MSILSTNFALPPTHDERRIAEVTRKAGISGIQISRTGGAALMPQTLNIGFSVLSAAQRQHAIVSAGFAALTVRPTVSGAVVTLPPQAMYLGGRLTRLALAGDAPFVLDLTTANLGERHAVYVEWYESVVTPSTSGGNPAALAGVSSTLNKPNDDGLFPGGALSRNSSSETISDSALTAGTSVQAQRFTQTQYTVYNALDRDLLGTAPTIVPSLPNWQPNPDDPLAISVRSEQPSDYLPSNPTPRTSDGFYYCAKLCVVERTSTGATVYNYDQPFINGQRGAPVSRSTGITDAAVRQLQTIVLGNNTRVAAVEARQTAVEGNLVPIGGSYTYWADPSTLPDNVVPMDGRALPRQSAPGVTNPLFTLLGTTFGVGDGIATFNIPDTRDRWIVAAGGAYALGATGGVASVTLSATEMPNHNHSVSIDANGNHNHGVVVNAGGGHTHVAQTSAIGVGQDGEHAHYMVGTTPNSINTSGPFGTEQTPGNTKVPVIASTDLGSGGLPDDWVGGPIGSTNSAIPTIPPGATQVAVWNEGSGHVHDVDVTATANHTHSITEATTGSHTHTASIGNTGGGAAHENRPPFIAGYQVMRIA
jgi:microcystin-dependent protein